MGGTCPSGSFLKIDGEEEICCCTDLGCCWNQCDRAPKWCIAGVPESKWVWNAEIRKFQLRATGLPDGEKSLECDSFYMILGYFFGNNQGDDDQEELGGNGQRFLSICKNNAEDPINCYGLTGMAYVYAMIEQKFNFTTFYHDLCKIHQENYSTGVKFCENDEGSLCVEKIPEVADKVAIIEEVKKFVEPLDIDDDYDNFIRDWKNSYKKQIQDNADKICSAICPK